MGFMFQALKFANMSDKYHDPNLSFWLSLQKGLFNLYENFTKEATWIRSKSC